MFAKVFYVTCFVKIFLLLYFSLKHDICIKKNTSSEIYHFFIVETIAESVHLIQVSKWNRKLITMTENKGFYKKVRIKTESKMIL